MHGPLAPLALECPPGELPLQVALRLEEEHPEPLGREHGRTVGKDVAAQNIASQVRGEPPTKEENFGDIPAVCIMDAGNNGVVILADRMLPPRNHGVMIPGPQSHAAKIAFEKYFLWKARHGYVRLP